MPASEPGILCMYAGIYVEIITTIEHRAENLLINKGIINSPKVCKNKEGVI